jgi:3-deoxy-D-manno-octulosonate 8-phosphate phosphatase KdsC-like HAD superfamily phosphatase
VAERALVDDARFARVRMLVLDFDGVLTDNTVSVTVRRGGVGDLLAW